MPTLLEVMQSRLGIQEIPGKQHNPIIVDWARDAGHPEIVDDETSWCSLSLCSAAKEAGLPFPPVNVNPLARSWLTWGVAVAPEDAQPGDVVIWPRGDAKGWQGHVNVVETVLANGRVKCIGGNQSGLAGGDAVTRTKSVSLKNALGVRRAVPATVPALRKAGSTEIKQADHDQNTGWLITVISGAVAAAQDLLTPVAVPEFSSLPEQLTFWQQVLGGFNAVMGLVGAHPWLAGTLFAGLVLVVVAQRRKAQRLAKHAAGVPLSVEVARVAPPVTGGPDSPYPYAGKA